MEYSRTEKLTTPAIASNAATITSDVMRGYVDYIKLEVRTAAGTASSNTCTVTVTDSIGRTLLTATGITGIANEYPLQVNAKGTTGSAITGIYQRYHLAGQTLTFAVTSGTNTEFVIAYTIIAGA